MTRLFHTADLIRSALHMEDDLADLITSASHMAKALRVSYVGRTL